MAGGWIFDATPRLRRGVRIAALHAVAAAAVVATVKAPHPVNKGAGVYRETDSFPRSGMSDRREVRDYLFDILQAIGDIRSLLATLGGKQTPVLIRCVSSGVGVARLSASIHEYGRSREAGPKRGVG